MQDIATRSDIDQLVSDFYRQAINDPLIGRIFTNVAHLDLSVHLPVICDFWESILLGNMIYRGNPMLKHLDLARKTPLEAEHFARWLSLWEATVQANYTGEKAALAVQRARDIGRLMLHKIKLASE